MNDLEWGKGAELIVIGQSEEEKPQIQNSCGMYIRYAVRWRDPPRGEETENAHPANQVSSGNTKVEIGASSFAFNIQSKH